MSTVVAEETRQLVNRALHGDQRAMLQIVEKYKQRVFGLCYRMLGQREEAEDMSQESFLRVLNNLPKWDQSRDFEPWLMTITANRCRTQLAKRKRPSTSIEVTNGPEDSTWTHKNDADQLREELQLALALLPTNHRRAFQLFHEQQMNYVEIAKTLDVPTGTVKTWVHRARTAMVRRLADREVLEVRRRAV